MNFLKTKAEEEEDCSTSLHSEVRSEKRAIRDCLQLITDFNHKMSNGLSSALTSVFMDDIFEYNFKFKDRNNRKRVVQVSGKIEKFGYQEKSLILIVKDLTMYRELEITKISNQYKSNLLSSTSHELRNPLNGLLTS